MLSCRTRYSGDCAGRAKTEPETSLLVLVVGAFGKVATWRGSWSKPAVYVIPILSQIFPEADTALLAVSS